MGADLSVAFPPRGVDVNADIAIIDRGVAAHHPDLNVYRCLTFSSPKSPVATNTPIVIKENECRDERGKGFESVLLSAASFSMMYMPKAVFKDGRSRTANQLLPG